MSIRKIIGIENNVEDFRIQIVPKSITFPKNSKLFRLYLEKGMQIIGMFENDLSISQKQSFYRFRQVHPLQFRLINLNHSNYTWSLYSINPETFEQTFVDSASFSVQRTIKLYQVEFLERQRQIQTSFRENVITKAMILQLWEKTKKQMKACRSNQKCAFSKQQYQIEFHIQIKNILDYEAQKLARERQQRPLRRLSSENLSSISGSQVKIRQQGNWQIKDKPNQKGNFIQIDFSKYKSNKEKVDQICTKQTIQLQSDANKPKFQDVLDNFNAKVKIVDPKGQLIQEKQQQQNEKGRKKSYSDSSSGSNQQHPQKKFSLLSDIIEMSYEGSSSYGHPDHTRSNGFNLGALRKDRTIDYVIENQKPAPGINKVKTLPYESTYNRLQVKNEYRRAQTAEKNQKDIENSQLQEQSFVSSIQNNELSQKEKAKPSSGDPYGKWIILIAIIIIIGIISGNSIGEDSASKFSKKRLKQKKIAS